MPANDSGISLVQTNKKAQFIHMRTKRALFRGTTSFRRTLPTRRTHHPDSPTHFTGVYQGLAITGSPLPIYSRHYRDFFGSQSGRRSPFGTAGASSLWPTFSIRVPNVYSSRRRCIVFSCLRVLYLVQGRMSIGIREWLPI